MHGAWVSLYEMLAEQICPDLSGFYYVLVGLEQIHASINQAIIGTIVAHIKIPYGY